MRNDGFDPAELRGEHSVPVDAAPNGGSTHSSDDALGRRPNVPQQQQPDLRIPNHSPDWGFRSEQHDSE